MSCERLDHGLVVPPRSGAEPTSELIAMDEHDLVAFDDPGRERGPQDHDRGDPDVDAGAHKELIVKSRCFSAEGAG